ncbi:DUF4224 domain-containing protein [Alcaligenes sp. SDU_A2]|uniref:DUF4224 domain-containing protein n=1 Tax=Alcaligenes sp. SDU_A2 TaxID=3136634 RepID=UPI00311D9631
MANGLYLTPDELRLLTGYITRPAMIRWLERNDWPFVIGGTDRWPRVLREFHDRRMLGMPTQNKRAAAEPAWSVS